MAKQYSINTKLRIVRMHQTRRLSPKQIVQELAKDKIYVSARSVRLIIKKYRAKGIVEEPKKCNAKKKVTEEIKKYIDMRLEQNDELNSTVLVNEIAAKFNVTVCTSTIRQHRAKLGWTKSTPRYVQLIKRVNTVKRYNFAVACFARRESFNDVIFSDECTIQMDQHHTLCFRKRDSIHPQKMKPRPKHPDSVHVWAGISKRGPTPMVIFKGIMASNFYQLILEKALIPFTERVFPDGYRFQQDNDSKHCSDSTKKYMEEYNIAWWHTPPESPDLNPIECVWHELKQHLRANVKPRTRDELVNGIQAFWDAFTRERCVKYINHLHKAIPAVIECAGGATGH